MCRGAQCPGQSISVHILPVKNLGRDAWMGLGENEAHSPPRPRLLGLQPGLRRGSRLQVCDFRVPSLAPGSACLPADPTSNSSGGRDTWWYTDCLRAKPSICAFCIIYHHLQMEKLRLREATELAACQPASKCWSPDLASSLAGSRICLFVFFSFVCFFICCFCSFPGQ